VVLSALLSLGGDRRHSFVDRKWNLFWLARSKNRKPMSERREMKTRETPPVSKVIIRPSKLGRKPPRMSNKEEISRYRGRGERGRRPERAPVWTDAADRWQMESERRGERSERASSCSGRRPGPISSSRRSIFGGFRTGSVGTVSFPNLGPVSGRF